MNLTAIERELAVKDLRASADVIDRNGWAQGEYAERQEGKPVETWPVCALGAVNVATSGHPLGGGDWGTIQRFILTKETLSAHVGQSVIDWNDTPGRTAEQVTEAFRACADLIEAGA
jgi:hypothetical protein